MSTLCGLASWTPDLPTLEKKLGLMLETLRHSRRYAVDSSALEGAGLGRLYIPDSTPTTYLVRNSHRGSSIVLSGYIVNWKEITQDLSRQSNGSVQIRNPADLVAYLIMEKGTGSLRELNGIFAFAMWNPTARELFLGVDRYGIRPLYYLHKNNHLQFASEIKAISYNEAGLTPNYAALEEMLAFGYILGDHTFFEGVSRVPPATVLRFTEAGLSTNRYWWFDEVKINPNLKLEDYLEENRFLFRQAIERLADSVPECVIFLSSGHDSRRIIAELARLGRASKAYTAALVRPQDRFEIDTKIAAAICALLAIPHITSDFPAADLYPDLVTHKNLLLDFESDTHEWLLPLLAELELERGVNFDGLGGDILINALYLKHNPMFLPQASDNRKLAETMVRRHAPSWESPFRIRSDAPPMVERIHTILNNLPDSDNKITLTCLLTRVRREAAIMAYGLTSLKIDSLMPYMDNDLFCQSLTISPKLTTDLYPQGLILDMDFAEVMRIPSARTANLTIHCPERYLRFCRPIAKLSQRTWRTVLDSVTKEAWGSKRIRSQLTRKGLLKLAIVIAANKQANMLSKLVRKSWLLQSLAKRGGFFINRLALVAQWYQHLEEPDWRTEKLDQTRRFLFGEKG